MNRYAFYTSLLVIAAIGLGLSLLFFPSDEEEALMVFYDNRFDEAREKFLKLYNEGDRSVAVTMPLVWIDLHYANVEHAIRTLEAFIEENPDVPEAREYLGRLYRDAERPYDYLTNLKELYPFKPSKEILKEQEHLYGQFGNMKERKGAIRKLIQKREASEEEYLELAYHAFSEDPEEAAALLDRMVRELPLSELSFEGAHLFFSLYADAGKKERVSRFLTQYLKSARLEVWQALKLASSLKEREMYEEADRLFLALPPALQQLPGVMMAHAELMMAAGSEGRAYEMLKENHLRKTLPKPLYKTLLGLAVDYEADSEALTELLRTLPLEKIPEKTLFRVAKRALEKRESDSAATAGKQLSVEYLKEHPALAIALAVAANPPSEEEQKRLAKLHEQQSFSDPEEAALAELYDEKDYKTLAKEILLKVESLEEIPDEQLYSLASLYSELDIAEEGLPLFEKVKEREARLLLQVANGETEPLMHYLKKGRPKPWVLRDLFYVTVNKRQFSLAMQIAQKLNEEEPDGKNAPFLAAASILNGKAEKGIAYFKEQEFSELYIFALSAAAQEEKSLQKPLHRALVARLEKKGLSQEEREKWLEELLYSGGPHYVLDLVAEEELQSDRIADAYIEAAAATEQKELIARAVTTIVPQEERLPRLKGLASVAYGEGLGDLSETIYLKVLAKEPDDPEALKQLGIIAFGKGELKRAKRYLFRYLQTEEPDFIGLFTYGDIMKEEGCKWAARQLWIRAERKILTLKERDVEAETTLAQIKFRLKRPQQAACIYSRLVKEHPYLKTDFAHLLMDSGRPKRAESLLFGWEPEGREAKLNLLLARARFYKLTNRIKKALSLLCRLPHDHAVSAALADARYVSKWPLEALAAIDSAIRQQPENRFYRKAREEILIDYAPFFHYEHEYRKTGRQQQENFTRFHLMGRGRCNSLGELKLERDRMRLGAYARESDGALVPFDGSRDRAELSLTRHFCGGKSLKASLYAAEAILGFGLEGKRALYRDVFHFLAQYRYPDWDFVETTIEQGTRDRFALGWERRLTPQLQGSCTAGVNHYSLRGFSSAALSWTVNTLLTWTAPERLCPLRLLGDEAVFSLNYSFDKEKVIRTRKKENLFGESFSPLPASSRAVHNFYFFLFKRFTPFLATEGYGGYNYDQVTGGGMKPIGGVSLIFFKRKGLEARLTYNHSTSTEDENNTVDSFIAGLKYTY